MNVKLICHTKDCENLVACAAKLCYSSATIDDLIKNETQKNNLKFIDMLTKLGHESPMEHANFTFGVEGVSRSLLAQITRHRIASFSVQSQRYVLEDEFSFVIPPEIEKDEYLKKIFTDSMKNTQQTYSQLQEKLKQHHKNNLMLQGFDENEATKKAEKMSCEDARFVLPNACCCKFLITANARSLLNFFRLRCCNRAQWEIRKLAFKMLELAISVAPNLFKNAGPSCVHGKCTEGKMSCKKSYEVKQKIEEMFKQQVQFC